MSEDLSDATLYQLVNAFVAAVVEGKGEWTESLAALDRAIDGKTERYQRAAHFIRGKRRAMLGEGDYYKELSDTYYKRAKALQAQDDRMEQAIINMMHETEKKVVETPLGTLRLSKTPHVELRGDMAAILANLPEQYKREPDVEVNKKALLDDYRALVKALLKHMPEDEAIAHAKLKMPPLVEIVYKESVGGF